MINNQLPVSQKWLVDGFCWYSRGLIRKRFASFGVINSSALKGVAPEASLVVYMNHIGWWDPIVGMLLRDWGLPARTFYAPIDAEQLERYSVLKRMGFFGVTSSEGSGNRTKGATEFLGKSRSILSAPNTSLWITPEGKFCDARDHSAPLMPGLAHLASRMPGVVFLPVAVEYAFWADALPHIFCEIGSAVCFSETSLPGSSNCTKEEMNQHLTERLRETQLSLAKQVIDRNFDAFDYIVTNQAKRLSWYDFIRSCTARIRGQKFDPRHSAGLR